MRQWTRGQFTGNGDGVDQSPDPCKGEPAMQGKSFPCDFMVQPKIERSGISSLQNGQDEMTLSPFFHRRKILSIGGDLLDSPQRQ